MGFLEGKRPFTSSEVYEKLEERKQQYTGFSELPLEDKVRLTKVWKAEIEADWVTVSPKQTNLEGEQNV